MAPRATAVNRLLLHPAAKPAVFLFALAPFLWLASAALTAQAREEALLNEMRALRGEVEALREIIKRS